VNEVLSSSLMVCCVVVPLAPLTVILLPLVSSRPDELDSRRLVTICTRLGAKGAWTRRVRPSNEGESEETNRKTTTYGDPVLELDTTTRVEANSLEGLSDLNFSRTKQD
jgi:hypothetical protein